MKKAIMITGGTGTLGRHITAHLLQSPQNFARLVIFSRDEQKQHEMSRTFPSDQYPVHYILGDIRDYRSLARSLRGVDLVIHTAALKQVPTAEKNGYEYIKTNVIGTQNLIEAAEEHRVKQVVAFSTDKAVNPVGLYGASKLAADRLLINANQAGGPQFDIIRLGNIWGARSSVVPQFLQQRATGQLTITHPEASRFSITLDQCVAFLQTVLHEAKGREIFIPKMPSYRVKDLAEAIMPGGTHQVTDTRSGEKLHEALMADAEIPFAQAYDDYFVIRTVRTAQPLTDRAILHSDQNPAQLTIDDLQRLLSKNLR